MARCLSLASATGWWAAFSVGSGMHFVPLAVWATVDNSDGSVAGWPASFIAGVPPEDIADGSMMPIQARSNFSGFVHDTDFDELGQKLRRGKVPRQQWT